MAPPRPSFDLKAVGKLFNDTLTAIRDDTPDIEGLKPQAIEWLKAARYKLMSDIESAYYELERSRDTPLSRPQWVNPTQALHLSTVKVPLILEPYRVAFNNNLCELLRECGFQHLTAGHCVLGGIFLCIYFPAQVAATAAAAHEQEAPRTLHIEDEFSRAVNGTGRAGTLAATNFGRLLVHARGESTAAESNGGASKKRRRGVKKPESGEDGFVKEENEDDEGRRLRSATRASSAATLRSIAWSPRRSVRKRVKREE
ncbi:hypothetical protein B0H19DRAFT_286783 [Mycena capillaripes]|nr:hypothetical protein B0H19DRAFT_286783 [Mycena capillaripes]